MSLSLCNTFLSSARGTVGGMYSHWVRTGSAAASVGPIPPSGYHAPCARETPTSRAVRSGALAARMGAAQ